MTGARKTDDTYTHIFNLPDGTRLTYRADHGRMYCDVLHPRTRRPSTNPIERGVFGEHLRRLREVYDNVPATAGGAP